MSLSVTVTPNETFPDDSNVTRAMLRNAASPTVQVEGSVSNTDLASGAAVALEKLVGVTEGQILVGGLATHASGGSNKNIEAVTPSSNASVTAGGEITPTASFYLTGFINEKPLASLRRDLMELGVSVSGLNKEPEDHIAFLCEVMHGLISGTLSEGVGLIRQRAFFHKHIMSWGSRVFQDLEGAEAAVFYMPVGTIGKLFMALECEAFEMAA